MNTQKLHQRILLHELRTILLDKTREGTVIDEHWKSFILSQPHQDTTYLILADWLDEQGNELGTLCRIQCELIGCDFTVSAFASPQTTLQPTVTETLIKLSPNNHPFENDLSIARFIQAVTDTPKTSTQHELLHARWEITKELYPRKTQLGRTTRMLTDTLRYSAQNQNKHILVQSNDANTERKFDALATHLEVWGNGSWTAQNSAHFPNGNHIYFATHEQSGILVTSSVSQQQLMHDTSRTPQQIIREQLTKDGIDPNQPYQSEYSIEQQAHLIAQTIQPDITFTDHDSQHIDNITESLRQGWAENFYQD